MFDNNDAFKRIETSVMVEFIAREFCLDFEHPIALFRSSEGNPVCSLREMRAMARYGNIDRFGIKERKGKK